jgi:hypothetical protein
VEAGGQFIDRTELGPQVEKRDHHISEIIRVFFSRVGIGGGSLSSSIAR